MLIPPQSLRALGVLGINRRNADFILKYNPRSGYPFVDDKVKTKIVAEAAKLSVPKLYGIIDKQHDIRNLPNLIAPHADFVIKPASGSGGQGVLVIAGKVKHLYRTVSGTLMSLEELQHHVSNILGGMYSLGNRVDKAIVEYRVEFDTVFEKVSYVGVPDVRIVVFCGVPVMAMVRLPTRMSGGRANLHQGAIGAGIDIARGTTFGGVWKDHFIDEHPDTGNSILGIEIPQWQTLLEMASLCYKLTGLGYLGADIVLDKTLGPLLLELNARPGLSIQIANRSGLTPRLELVEKNYKSLHTPTERVDFAIRHFGAQGSSSQ